MSLTLVIGTASSQKRLRFIPPFAYTGRSLSVAYDFQSPGPFSSKNAVYSSNVASRSLTQTGFSATQLSDVLTDLSDFRPIIRLGFPFPAIEWNLVTSGIQNDLHELDVVDEDNAWACSLAGNAYHTSDRGLTWFDGGSAPDSLVAIVGFTNANAVMITGKESDTSGVYTTFDGGGRWSRTESFALTVCIAVAGRTSGASLWCLGAGRGDTIRLLTSNDRGLNWTQSTTGLVLEQGAGISKGSA